MTPTLAELDSKLSSIEAVADLDSKRARIAALNDEVAAPDLWDDPDNAQRVTQSLSNLQNEVERIEGLRQRLDDVAVLLELAAEEDDTDSAHEAASEIETLTSQIEELEVRTLLSGEYDPREAMVTIRAEAGGVDAADFAQMLLRMYTRWAERHHYKCQVYDISYAEEAGIKSATFQVNAPYAFGTLSVESGTHRLCLLYTSPSPRDRG